LTVEFRDCAGLCCWSIFCVWTSDAADILLHFGDDEQKIPKVPLPRIEELQALAANDKKTRAGVGAGALFPVKAVAVHNLL
jgi:hypothetical protein